MLGFVTYLAVFFYVMAIPAYVWPHRLCLFAYKWRGHRIMAACSWLLVGSQLLILRGFLQAYDVFGFCPFIVGLAVITTVFIAVGSYVHWRMQ